MCRLPFGFKVYLYFVWTAIPIESNHMTVTYATKRAQQRNINIMQQLYHLVVLVCFGLAYSENALPEQVHLSFGSKYYDQQERVVLYSHFTGIEYLPVSNICLLYME